MMISKLRLIGLIFLVFELFSATDPKSLLADEPPIGPAKLTWTSLPDLPNELGVAGPFVGVHNEALIVAGGANFPRPVWESQKHWLDQVWILSPTVSAMKWQSGGKLPRALAYGSAVSTPDGVVCIGFGQHQVFVLGGDDGSLFAKTDELKDQHPEFRKESLVYDTVTDNWTSAGATPQNHVTTIPVVWKNQMIIASGEVRPRVRTPAVWSVAPLGRLP